MTSDGYEIGVETLEEAGYDSAMKEFDFHTVCSSTRAGIVRELQLKYDEGWKPAGDVHKVAGDPNDTGSEHFSQYFCHVRREKENTSQLNAEEESQPQIRLVPRWDP